MTDLRSSSTGLYELENKSSWLVFSSEQIPQEFRRNCKAPSSFEHPMKTIGQHLVRVRRECILEDEDFDESTHRGNKEPFATRLAIVNTTDSHRLQLDPLRLKDILPVRLETRREHDDPLFLK